MSQVIIDYTNHRGERALRRIVPVSIELCPQGTEYHSAPGWYLRAYDIDKKGTRDFALADVHSWRNTTLTPAKRSPIENVDDGAS